MHGLKLFLALFDVGFSILEQAVYELGELVGSCGDCFWGAEFGEHAAVERAEGYAGLLHLLPQIEAAAGADKAAGLRAAMEGVARH